MNSMTSTVHTEASHSTDGDLTATSTEALLTGIATEWDTTDIVRLTITQIHGDTAITAGTMPRGTMSAAIIT